MLCFTKSIVNFSRLFLVSKRRVVSDRTKKERKGRARENVSCIGRRTVADAEGPERISEDGAKTHAGEGQIRSFRRRSRRSLPPTILCHC